MHLLLPIAFILCVAHYGLIRGTGHFIFGFLRALALLGIALILVFAVGTHYPVLGSISIGLFVIWVVSRKRL